MYQKYKVRSKTDSYTYPYRVLRELKTLNILLSDINLPFCKDDRLLDLGCGSGQWSIELAKMCESVYGIDIDERQLSELIKILGKDEITNVFIEQGDLKEYKFEELRLFTKFFNRVYIGVLFQYLTNEEVSRILLNMRCILEDDAIIIIKESLADETTIASDGDIRRSVVDIKNLFKGNGYTFLRWGLTGYFDYQGFFVFKYVKYVANNG
jgi:cyclopropane fatty-acyl-phospholipid synthase-like methyltransferase